MLDHRLINNGQKTADGRFASGNAYGTGRPSGVRNKATMMMEHIHGGEAELVTRKLIDAALGGDVACLKICMDRILPNRKERPVRFNLSALTCSADAVKAMQAIIAEVACGSMLLSEARHLFGLLQAYTENQAIPAMAQQIEELARRVGGDGQY